ncbi:hypothetical protein PanWU01x14_116380 [Parasponia andersonii]|uniref:Uncharacterized protein n=1 Tax=Parasponia andersonii TaxID=3476 RepID=A0A2P5CWW5_PARAD|nr:hypothetical protein PanWU01x14_116380 [Parasponia andersonii]
MEVSVLGAGMQHALTRSLPLSFPLTSSLTIRPKNSRLIYATTSTSTSTLVRERGSEQPNNGQVGVQMLHSKSYLSRKSAILEVQLSPDLDSALSSYGDVLKVQDLNAIIRHFGKRRRWRKLSQVLHVANSDFIWEIVYLIQFTGQHGLCKYCLAIVVTMELLHT